MFQQCLVLHASDLPKNRGWSPHVWSILNGENDITLSLLEAEDKVDMGRIWKKAKIKLNIENMLDGTERFIGSKSTELIYMAEGKIDLIIYPKIHIWESAAGILICKESGVFVTDFNGNDDIYNSKSLIASKEWLHKKILPKVC